MKRLKDVSSEMKVRMSRRREAAAARRFALSAGEVSQVSTRLTQLCRAKQMHERAMRTLIDDGGDALNLNMYRQCLADIENAIDEEKSRLQLASERAGMRRSELIRAMGWRRGAKDVSRRTAGA